MSSSRALVLDARSLSLSNVVRACWRFWLFRSSDPERAEIALSISASHLRATYAEAGAR